MFLFTITFYVIFFHGLGSFTFLAKDLFSKSLGFNVQNCNFYFAKSTTNFGLDHERCTLSNAVVFLQNSEPGNALPTKFSLL